MNYDPTAAVDSRYGSQILTARYYIQHTERGEIDSVKSYAALTLHDLASARFPLVWSITVTPEQATAALKIFEATGVTLDPAETKNAR